ncbi:FAD-dependent oxidoreductase [Rhodocytophaga rosea]|uniref:FAD-dependent oxidoreductase n=1 Tax=Rhodocytophaga rosea TaxID=2704465 RepID=A0A6C0GIQ7_9BACT|nr:FAD-dependent oxidoreductase [Rhodocytophaga rosea]QHT67941.1 FAD-dependent oxidoreductase [Rhodocytophaga rosea]
MSTISENKPLHTLHQAELATFAPEVKAGFQEKVKSVAIIPSLHTHIVVIGAGAFGGWTALQLLRQGLQVTLLDAWGAGNSRSSSGDETRVIRCMYGANQMYFDLTLRAISLWQDFEKQTSKKLLFKTGLLWFLYQPHDETIDAALPLLEKNGLSYEKMSVQEAENRYPAIHVADLNHVFLEKEAGYLKARESCQAVAEAFVQEGGIYTQLSALPGKIEGNKLKEIQLSDGNTLQADAYVFACGPWLGQLFPEVTGHILYSARQEVYYFGTPAAQSSLFENLPVWIDWNIQDTVYYGIPGSTHRGFKTAYDRKGGGELFDPTHGERIITKAELDRAKAFLAHRFPALKGAPLTESRVCQYPNSPDGNFLVDIHPQASNTWLIGGGSGHGFKMGPALGEMAAQIILGQQNLPTLFSLNRFGNFTVVH